MLYCAQTVSLCALEVLAQNAALPHDMISMSAEIPDTIISMALLTDKLPQDWNSRVPSASTKMIGTRWARLKGSLALMVPSVIVPDEFNVLVNPLHPNFAGVIFSAPKPFIFDERLK